jgi:hypothetical protein
MINSSKRLVENAHVLQEMPPLASADDNPRIYDPTAQKGCLVYLGIQLSRSLAKTEPEKWPIVVSGQSYGHLLKRDWNHGELKIPKSIPVPRSMLPIFAIRKIAIECSIK